MAKLDKDRYLKEMAVQLSLLKKMLPYPECIVSTTSDLSDTVEVVTDIDVLGIGMSAYDGLHRTVFDCKSGKMSGISRALWASGLVSYTGCNDAVVLLKSSAPYNHRVSALKVGVDLQDEASFAEMGRMLDPAFPSATHYQSTLERWDALNSIYAANPWAQQISELLNGTVPLTTTPWSVFRRLIAETRVIKGEFDPAKDKHLAVFLDLLSGYFLLWTAMGRDIRKIYDPKMTKAGFETALRYYMWGGRDSYRIRQQIKEIHSTAGDSSIVTIPAWTKLFNFTGITLQAPSALFDCALECKELSIRLASGSDAALDKNIAFRLRQNNRILQFVISMTDYVVEAAGLPKDMAKRVEEVFIAANT